MHTYGNKMSTVFKISTTLPSRLLAEAINRHLQSDWLIHNSNLSYSVYASCWMSNATIDKCIRAMHTRCYFICLDGELDAIWSAILLYAKHRVNNEVAIWGIPECGPGGQPLLLRCCRKSQRASCTSSPIWSRLPGSVAHSYPQLTL